MIDFIIALLFGKSLLLTSAPIDVSSTYQIRLEQPISAVTEGAIIEIEVPVETFSSVTRVDEINAAAQSAFPLRSIGAHLSQPGGGRTLDFVYKGSRGQTGNRVLLKLESDEKIPTKVEFNQLELYTNIQLHRVMIYWRNCKQVGG